MSIKRSTNNEKIFCDSYKKELGSSMFQSLDYSLMKKAFWCGLGVLAVAAIIASAF